MKSKESQSLEPIIKWPGGKERELKYIFPNLPAKFERFFDPFVGGGSVFMAVNSPKYYINDLSTELYELYLCIKNRTKEFYEISYSFDESWSSVEFFFDVHKNELSQLYSDFKNSSIDLNELKNKIEAFVTINRKRLIDSLFSKVDADYFISEIRSTMLRKMQRMYVLEKERGAMPLQDVFDNIETIFKGALYMYYRNIYNAQGKTMNTLKIALFFFLRNYAYSGMFRYNANGNFNVPYGGIAYNRKKLSKKLNFYESTVVQNRIYKTTIENLDFEAFLKRYELTDQDFIFLDPPYDSEFSTYAQNEFSKKDQQRLADYLINECPAKWMLVIKNTNYIHSLYFGHPGISIGTFDKEYTVSFMNRNDKRVTHLLIKNYV